MEQYYDSLTTEMINKETQHIDTCDFLGIVTLINRQDSQVAGAWNYPAGYCDRINSQRKCPLCIGGGTDGQGTGSKN